MLIDLEFPAGQGNLHEFLSGSTRYFALFTKPKGGRMGSHTWRFARNLEGKINIATNLPELLSRRHIFRSPLYIALICKKIVLHRLIF